MKKLEKIKAELLKRNEKSLMNPPLDMQKIIDFENKYGIKLPEELVEFYTQVANGAVLYPNPNDDICNLLPLEEWFFNEELINENFNVENDIEYHDFEKITSDDFIYYGNIAIMDLGCEMSYNIIVKGLHYGEIFANCEMWLPLTHLNFYDWLESCISGEAFGML